MMYPEEMPTAPMLARPVVVETNFKFKNFNRRYTLERKECFLFNSICYLSKKNDEWILQFSNKDTTRYRFRVGSKEQFFKIVNNLGVRDGFYKVKVKNDKKRLLNVIKQAGLENALEWIFDIDYELSNVLIEQI